MHATRICCVALLKPPVSRVLAGKSQAHSRGSNPGEGMGERDACYRAGKRRNGVGSAVGNETMPQRCSS
jgi:hypothetical protein